MIVGYSWHDCSSIHQYSYIAVYNHGAKSDNRQKQTEQYHKMTVISKEKYEVCSFLYQASSFKAAQYKLVTKISSGRKSSEIEKGKIDFLSSLLD